ncbi:sodium:solute symporter family protein [Sporobolomyces koalae]|uniref:sodium:solute symporter family protein n=1 Tax=Sporobolomyces koalae TaxID=500713 RepID=UPI00316F550F
MSAAGFPDGEAPFAPLLGAGVGYGVVVGASLFFALFMFVLTKLQARFTRLNPQTASEFIAASRSVKPGLICCGIVSAWTWSATLLQSSVGTYNSGVSGAYWYGVGGTIQIAFFAVMAAKVKMNANGAVTYLQIVHRRYGTACHILMTAAALICAHIVTGSLILGASATINALTSANIIACNFLLPVGIAIYVLLGGLRATFLVDFLHTVILFIIIYYFVFVTYGTSDLIGSPSKMYDLLKEAAIRVPVAGNAEGSYLTLKSNSGMLFAASTIATGFSDKFVSVPSSLTLVQTELLIDISLGYWQRAIASRPESTTKSYFFGGLAWFAVPFAFGSCLGLAGRGLMSNPSFPTFPYALSSSQVSAGLVAPAAAATLLGKAGSVAMLLVVFMASTSATSAELIAVSSIVTFDIIGRYKKTKLTAKQSLRFSEYAIAGYAVWAGAWATILHIAGIDLGWLFFVQGVLLTPAVFPVACTVCWSKCSKEAVLGGTGFGVVCAMTAWFVACHKCYGAINVPNLALPYSAVSGASAGLVMSTLATLIITFIKPDNYDWTGTRAIAIASDDASIKTHIEEEPVASGLDSAAAFEKKDETPVSGLAQAPALVNERDGEEACSDVPEHEAELDRDMLNKVFKKATWGSGLIAVIITFIIPLPLFFSHYIFSRHFFTGWIAISIIWVLISGFLCILLPIWESKREMFLIARGAVRAVSGRGSSKDVVA